jgi:cell division septal protein FtsQ
MMNALLAVVLAGSCWLAWQGYELLTHAEMFQIAGVDVKGVHELSDAELKSIVGPFTGQNIFRADLESALRRARVNARVREATIHRALPNRITLSIVERVPAALLETDAGGYLIDNEAVVIERANERKPGIQLPVIAIKDYKPHPGEPVTAESINEALTLLAEVEARGGWNMAEVRVKAATPETLSLVYADHEFKIGSGRYAEKLRRLAEIMADVKQRNVTIAYVDVRPETQAAVMMKTPAGKGKAPDKARQRTNKRR